MKEKERLAKYGIWYDDPNDKLKDLIKVNEDKYTIRIFFKDECERLHRPEYAIMVNGMLTNTDCIILYYNPDSNKIYEIDLRAGYWIGEICYINIKVPPYNDNEIIAHITPAKIKGAPKDYMETAMHIVIGSGINNMPNEINLKED